MSEWEKHCLVIFLLVMFFGYATVSAMRKAAGFFNTNDKAKQVGLDLLSRWLRK